MSAIVAGFLMWQIAQGDIGTYEVVSVVTGGDLAEKVGQISKPVFEEKSESEKSLSIMAFGDMMLGRFVRTLMERDGKDFIFENFEFPEAEIRFANLEGPIKGDGYKHQTAMRFGFHTDTADFLKENGFNVLSIVNNHAIDQGWDGRDSTIAELERVGIGWCGHPTEAVRESVLFGESESGASYAFVCFNDVIMDTDNAAMWNLVKDVDDEVDYVIVSIHWGVEYAHKPHQKLQVELGHALVDAGADLILGHHPHVVQTYEKYNGKMIFYSLGNFVFDQYWSRDTQEELGVRVVLSGVGRDFDTEFELYPIVSERSAVRMMEGQELEEWMGRFRGYFE